MQGLPSVSRRKVLGSCVEVRRALDVSPALLICSELARDFPSVRALYPSCLHLMNASIFLLSHRQSPVPYTTTQCQLVHDQLRNSPRPLPNARLRFVMLILPSSRASLIISQGAVYGKCIVANYQNAHKDMCAKEFMLLKDCYLVCQTSNYRLQSMLIQHQKAAGKKA